MDSMQTGSSRLTFSLAGLFLAVTLAALAVKWPRLMLLAIPALPWFAARPFAAAARGASLFRYGLVIAAVYLPALPGFFLDCSHCRRFWWENFPIVPGVVPALLSVKALGFGRLTDWIEFTIAGVIVCGSIGALYLIGAVGRVRLAISIIVGLAGSALACLILSGLLRA